MIPVGLIIKILTDYELKHKKIKHQINNENYKEEIRKLKTFYDEFVANTPATGKTEMIQQKQK